MNDRETEMLDALLEIEEGLSDYEMQFVEDLSHFSPNAKLTDRQHHKLVEIYEKHC